QALRKESGLEITDRIRVAVGSHAETDEAVAAFRDYIASQVLAESVEVTAVTADTVVDFDDFALPVTIAKA
ncbi:MAG: hypothetical protein HUK00_05220, partial [Bacteroidaceae bacterium]|nr:hypothetical protein [Bacteroidaceae bacterium]